MKMQQFMAQISEQKRVAGVRVLVIFVVGFCDKTCFAKCSSLELKIASKKGWERNGFANTRLSGIC